MKKHMPFFAYRFLEKLEQDIPGEGVKQQLEALCGIYYLSLLHKHQGDFLATSYITPKQSALANELLRTLLTKVCPLSCDWIEGFENKF